MAIGLLSSKLLFLSSVINAIFILQKEIFYEMNTSFKVGQKLNLEISDVNFNHVVVGKDDKEAFLYNRDMPKVTVEVLIVDEDEKNVVLVEEEIDGENKLVLPGATILPEEASGETGMSKLIWNLEIWSCTIFVQILIVTTDSG